MKPFISFLTVLLPTFISAQNIQLHYDFGKQEDGFVRHYLIGTFEFFRPDTLGYTFFFTDFEFNSSDKPRGASLGYFELSRAFSIPWFRDKSILKNLLIHVEYDDGNAIFPLDDSTTEGINLNNSWLGGTEYAVMLGDLSLDAMVLYKYIRGSSAPDVQFTLVWYYPIWQNRFNLSGYIDIWSQDNPGNNKKMAIIYAEPQVWFNPIKHLSIGSEWKISKNFIEGSQRVEVFPTLGVKWEF